MVERSGRTHPRRLKLRIFLSDREFYFLIPLREYFDCPPSQARVMAGHNGRGSSITQTQSSHIQSNVIKTMILVSALYVILWTPNYIYSLLLHFKTDLIPTAHHARKKASESVAMPAPGTAATRATYQLS